MPWVPASSVLCPPPTPGCVERRRRVPKLVERSRLPSISTHLPPVCTRGRGGHLAWSACRPSPCGVAGPAPGVHCRLPPRLRHLHPVLRAPPVSRDSSGTAPASLLHYKWARVGTRPAGGPGHSAEPPSLQTQGPLQRLPAAGPWLSWWGPERRGRDSEHELLPCGLVTPVAIRVCDAASAKGYRMRIFPEGGVPLRSCDAAES